jgi:hypothetical protein
MQIQMDIMASGAMSELVGDSGREIRMGLATELPTSLDEGIAREGVLYAIATHPAVPRKGQPHPIRPNLIVSTVRATVAANSASATIEVLYEAFGSSTASSLIVEFDCSPTTFETNMMPGTREPFEVGFQPTTPLVGNTSYMPIPPGYVTITMLQTLEVVSVTQLVPGAISIDQQAAFVRNAGFCNSVPWLGKPAGAWYISRANATSSRFGGFYQTNLRAMSRGDELWSYYGILQDQTTGRFAGGPDVQDALDTLRGLPYAARHSRTVQTNGKDQGVIRIDPYRVQPYAPLFGF